MTLRSKIMVVFNVPSLCQLLLYSYSKGQHMHHETKSLNVSSISSAQNELKDPARLEDAAQSSPSDTLSCLEMVLQGASFCVCTAASP